LAIGPKSKVNAKRIVLFDDVRTETANRGGLARYQGKELRRDDVSVIGFTID